MYSKYKNYIDLSANYGPREIEQNPLNQLKLSLKNSKPDMRYQFHKIDVLTRSNVKELNLLQSQHYVRKRPFIKSVCSEIISPEVDIPHYPKEHKYKPIAGNPIRNLLIDEDDGYETESQYYYDVFPPLSLAPDFINPIMPYRPLFLENFSQALAGAKKQKKKKNVIVVLLKEPTEPVDFLQEMFKGYEFVKSHRMSRDYVEMFDFGTHFFNHTFKLVVPMMGRNRGLFGNGNPMEALLQHIERESLSLEIRNIKELFRQHASFKTSIIPLMYDINETMKYCLFVESSRNKAQKLFRMLVYAFFCFNYLSYTQMIDNQNQKQATYKFIETDKAH